VQHIVGRAAERLAVAIDGRHRIDGLFGRQGAETGEADEGALQIVVAIDADIAAHRAPAVAGKRDGLAAVHDARIGFGCGAGQPALDGRVGL
jgi:hypothetical protein